MRSPKRNLVGGFLIIATIFISASIFRLKSNGELKNSPVSTDANKSNNINMLKANVASNDLRSKSPAKVQFKNEEVASSEETSFMGEQEKETVIEAVLNLQNHRLSDRREESNRILTKYGDRALKVMIEVLKSGNISTSDIQMRLGLIDALGKASKTKSFVLNFLKDYATSPVDSQKPQELAYRDILDKLEAFEYVSRNDESFCVKFIRKMSPGTLRNSYIKHFIIGLKMEGVDEKNAIEKAYRVIELGIEV